MLAILLESTETRCILSLMRMKLRWIRCGSLCFTFPRQLFAGSDAENAQRYRSCPGRGLRLIRLDGSSDPERKLKWLRESGHALPLHEHVAFGGFNSPSRHQHRPNDCPTTAKKPDFYSGTAPPIVELYASISQSMTRAQNSSLRIGTAGWTIPRESSAHFISEGTHLERYSRALNCCEINSSFYRPHRHGTWEKWAKSVASDFRFSVKAPKAITHQARLNCGLELLSPFLEQISFLGDKLGPVLFQLPPSFAFDGATARKFLSLLRENYSGDVVWEPRHSTWFDDRSDPLLHEFSIARVAADPACVPAAALPGGFADVAYFRLHGSPRLYYSEYTEEFLKSLAARLLDLAAQTQVWCIFDNTAAGFAIQNALELNIKVENVVGAAPR
jgi:uncharacterized protein YecE (DUF72 family)